MNSANNPPPDLRYQSIDRGLSIPLIDRKDDEAIVQPAEADGVILGMKGNNRAVVEFLLADQSLKRIEMLGTEYKGPGAYRLNYFEAKEGEDVPFWVIVEQRQFTVGEAKRLLRAVQVILDTEAYIDQEYWDTKQLER